MRIGLLSDTHIPEVAQAVPLEVLEAFRGVDLILHAGDIYIPRVLDELQDIAPVLAAEGDDDYGDTLRDERVKRKHNLTLEGHTLWLIHERWYFNKFTSQPSTKPVLQDKDGGPDIVVFGHEHRVIVQLSGDVLYVNPGSPTLLNYRRGLGTVAILNIESSEAHVAILQLNDENQPPTIVSQTNCSFQPKSTTGQQMTAEELMQLPDCELELTVAEKVLGWRFAPETLEASDVEAAGYPQKGQNDTWCSHTRFCSDLTASHELDKAMEKLGWRYEQRPAHPGNEGFWVYGVAYSSGDYWVGLAVESPSLIRKAKCAAAILAVEGRGWQRRDS